MRIVESRNSSRMVLETGRVSLGAWETDLAYSIRRSHLVTISRATFSGLTVNARSGFVHDEQLIALEDGSSHAGSRQLACYSVVMSSAYHMSCFSPWEKLSPPSLATC